MLEKSRFKPATVVYNKLTTNVLEPQRGKYVTVDPSTALDIKKSDTQNSGGDTKPKPITLRRAQQPKEVQPVVSVTPVTPPRMELKWPPVLSNGSIPVNDGSDVMPLTGIKVPKFWTPPENVPLEKTGSKVNGVETIFLMIASYRDFQCRETIASAFSMADHPEALYIGAADQVSNGDISCTQTDTSCEEDPSQLLCKYRDQIAVYTMAAEMATGPVTARHIGDRLYRGQYFVMQMDAHCTFVKHWDTQIKDQWRQTHNEMAVLSSYLSDVQNSIDANGKSRRNTRPIMCNSAFEGIMPARYLRHGSQPEDYAVVRDMPQLEPFWAAGFSFSRGHFKVRVPYDGRQPMVFQGEEISIGIRGFTHGYDFYAPRDSVVFHEYAERSSRRKKIHMFWENSPKHQGEGKKSLMRSMAIIKMAPDIADSEWDHTEIDRYGVGNVRSVELFYKLFLIDTKNRQSVQLCPFVKNGGMHKEFQKYLRKDGLGIDYSHLENFDTSAYIEKVFESQRGPGEKMIRSAMEKNNMNSLEWALENARRIGIDKKNPDLYSEGSKKLQQLKTGGK